MRNSIEATLEKFNNIEYTVEEGSHEFILTEIARNLRFQFEYLMLQDDYDGEVFNDDKVEQSLDVYDLEVDNFEYINDARDLQRDIENYLKGFYSDEV